MCLESSLLGHHGHHNRQKGRPWPTKFWCPVRTCHHLGGRKGRRGGALPMTPLGLGQLGPSPANLAQPGRLPITGSSLPS